ncbi:hypothetical protein QX776_14850 [Alteromonadaceae bacterium BrNp21-10]|nr:hypothetical protein [Alteromonadaceae bacterium BrNp21-10]
MNRLYLSLIVLSLSGCQLMQEGLQNRGYMQPDCQTEDVQLYISDAPCDVINWLQYWAEQDQLEWQFRKESLAELTTSEVDNLKAIILSQPMDTPYQNRLRAQNNWLLVADKLTPKLALLLSHLMSKTSQKLLEYESALVTIGRINSRQAQTIQQQDQELEQLTLVLEQQQHKIEQLLNIETQLGNGEKQNGSN